MIRIINGCDWVNRYGEAYDLGFDGIRISIPEVDKLFPNKPVFLPSNTRRYLYEVDWTATASGVNKFETYVPSFYNHGYAFIHQLQAAKALGWHVIIPINYNGYGGDWTTPGTYFSYGLSAISASGTATSGTSTIPVNALPADLPAGSSLTFCRSGSYRGRMWVSANANAGSTSIPVYGILSTIAVSDIFAVIRAGAYIGTITATAAVQITTAAEHALAIPVTATGFNILANDVLLHLRGATVITTAITAARAAAGATSLTTVSPLSATINSGDYTTAADAPTATEPYGYRSPHPSDAQANTDIALAIAAYVLNDPNILYPPELVTLEEWNEPDNPTFGGQGVPGISGLYEWGYGFFSYNVKYLQSVRAPQVAAAFPNITYLCSGFCQGGELSTTVSARLGNFSTPGFAQTSGIDSYWFSFNGMNMHSYAVTTDGSKYDGANKFYDTIVNTKNGVKSVSQALHDLPWYMTESGSAPFLYSNTIPNSDKHLGEMILVQHDVCRALGFKAWGNYCYNFRSTTYPITASGTSSIGATTINLSGTTGVAIPSGTVLYFGSQGAKATLTASASSGATSLSVAALTTAITNGNKTWYQSRTAGQYYHMIPDMIVRNNLFIGVGDPNGKNNKFWAVAERFARVTLPTTPVPIPES